ncbi:MAG: hypothetical protein IPL67_19450 [Ignavibacteria bacterium]|nr:hypothetical protein [Ignavibacteria bacterium]
MIWKQSCTDGLILVALQREVNTTDSIDGTDLSEIDNDAFNFESGYRVTDVNGDNITDGSDLLSLITTLPTLSQNYHPETSPSDLIS